VDLLDEKLGDVRRRAVLVRVHVGVDWHDGRVELDRRKGADESRPGGQHHARVEGSTHREVLDALDTKLGRVSLYESESLVEK